jgi:hypothetical protein
MRHVPLKRSTPRRRVRNRRHRPIAPRLLAVLTALLAVETIAALAFSPRLTVRRITVSGNRTVATSALLDRVNIGPRENLLRLPLADLRAALRAEPGIADAVLQRRLPDTLAIAVVERTAYASVRVAGGTFVTIDANRVPFRAGKAPEPGLPLLEWAAIQAPALGKPLPALGLEDASHCVAWAQGHPEFPIETVRIDEKGALTLVRRGGLPVRLGRGIDLERKLETLEFLLSDRADLRTGASQDLLSINLVAWDAPAVRFRTLPTPDPLKKGSP